MSRRDDTLRLRDMLDAAQAAIRVLGGHKPCSRPFCEAHPEIAWSAVTGMCHRIVHDYSAVDYQRLCDTVRNDLPPLIAQPERILEDSDKS